MGHARYLVGDVRKILPTLEPGSIDLVLTSPPFLALRSYLPADHPDKPAEIGSEPTPAAYIDTLLDIVELLTPLLAPHGSMCIELGDTYSGSGGAGGDYSDEGLRAEQPRFNGSAAASRVQPVGNQLDRRTRASGARTQDESRLGVDARNRARRGGNARLSNTSDDWPEPKSLCMIPESFRWALVYGHNPFNGRPTPPWRARNVIRWCRPNPPVGALGDKVRPATSEMVVICKSRTRYFDLDAVRTPYSENSHARTAAGIGPKQRTAKTAPDGNRQTLEDLNNNGAGAPPLDWWNIPTQPYPGAHYATWPEALCVKPIEMMCPHRVCRACGKPSVRVVEATKWEHREHPLERAGIQRGGLGAHGDRAASPTTLGWSRCLCPCPNDRAHGFCGCPERWRPGMVLDPFAGSGTTLQVATGHGRDAIGIDLDARNAHLAADRVGMFLEVVA